MEFKTVIVRGKIMTKKVGSECEFEFETEVNSELEGDALEDELAESAQEAAFELINWHYTVDVKV